MNFEECVSHRSSPNKAPPKAEDQKALVKQLLGVRRLGPPPFLVRNLQYVKTQKHQASNLFWDLRWGQGTTRGEENTRQLLLMCMPKRCVLPDASIRRHFGPQQRVNSSNIQEAKIRVWLSVILSGDEVLAFGVREHTVRLWPKSLADAGFPLNDIPITQAFDLSAVMSFLDHFPSRLSIITELYVMKASCILVDQNPVLCGEQCLLDANHSMTTSVPNKDFIVELRPFSAQDIPKQPAMGLQPKVDSDMVNIASVTANGHADHSALAQSEHSSPSSEPQSLHGMHGTLTLSLRGTLHKKGNAPQGFDPFCEHVLIRCSYKSPEFPWWDGLTRHDFVCPWCHRNCRRLKTLLFHFQLDHDRAKLSLDAIQQSGESTNDPFFTVNMSIIPAPAYDQADSHSVGADVSHNQQSNGHKTNATITSVDENVMVNRNRYPLYPASSDGDKRTEELDMAKCAVQDGGADNDSDTTIIEEEIDANLESIMREGWKKCHHCGRPHQGLYRCNINFCCEWCEIAFNSNVPLEPEEEDSSTNGMRTRTRTKAPLSSLASSTRRPRINYKDTLGMRTLYHVVSLNPVLEEHFDEDDADSEDEVDHSWRLRITEDKVNHIEGAMAKERVLWILWNRYAHESYPAPGAYAERYTRHSLELFVFEYGIEIRRLHLRNAVIGLLRACHIHGVIDAEGFKSVMLCLDGKKKRRQCAISSRPEGETINMQHRNKSKKSKSKIKRKR